MSSRYLLVSGAVPSTVLASDTDTNPDPVPCIGIDPKHPLTMSGVASNSPSTIISIPETSHKLDRLLVRCQSEHIEEDFDDEDQLVLELL